MGWASTQLSPLTEAFVAFAATAPAPVLDIGGAPGLAAAAALVAGAEVIANDLDAGLLTELAPSVRLRIVPGRFPREMHFDPETLGAVHASSVFHFLTGNQLDAGLRAISNWLRPGGKLFVQTSTPYQLPFAAFIPEYERRLAGGVKWPGWLAKAGEFAVHRQMGQMPGSLHLLDEVVLSRAALNAGLQVERAWLYRRPDFPRTLCLDGRESAALIAVKAVTS
jgi:SAM-dependent methyltransferase